MKKIRILDVQFEEEIEPWELKYLRGAIVSTVGKSHVLFHNHDESGFRYSYPLIQYKVIGKKPHIVCIDQGVDDVHHFFEKKQEGIFLGDRPYELKVNAINLNSFTMQVWDKAFHYRISSWLPLNQKNYAVYHSIDDEQEKKNFLQKILNGNILSFAKGIDWHIDKQIITQIKDIQNTSQIKIKSVKREAYTVTFRTNVFLPHFIGLGKNSSLGFGVVSEERKIRKVTNN
jgi:CRISPR/Cas system endoribonuclease Cas6 (RAMP superfamily)